MKLSNTIILAGVALILGIGYLWYQSSSETVRISVGAGNRSTPVYAVASAIKLTVEKHYPKITVDLHETQGSMHNARLLSRGLVDVAITELELVSGADIRFVSQVFPASYHLIAQNDSDIANINDLKGKRVSLPPEESEEYRLFVQLIEHYGIARSDLYLLPGTYQAGEWLFEAGAVDAIFRIRATGDDNIKDFLKETGGKLIVIDHAEALELINPALEPAHIPAGAYSGNPPVPVKNLDTIALRRALLASKDANVTAITALTSALFEYRYELMERVPTVGNISAPDQSEGISLPLHEGARRYFSQDDPNFIQENAEPLALLLSVIIVFASTSAHFSNIANRKRMDRFNRQLVQLAAQARKATSFEEVDKYDAQLGAFFGRIIDASEQGKINAQEFAIFKFAFQATEDAIRDREYQLRRSQEDDSDGQRRHEDDSRPRNRMTKVN